jgi:hypothetical protein
MSRQVVIVFSLKGWQIVAGGRSAAQTTGKQNQESSTLEGCKTGLNGGLNFFQSSLPHHFFY